MTHKFEDISIKDGGMTVDISMDRFERQFDEAQYKLDSMVMTSMVPYMPHNSGMFINITKAMSAPIAGTGKVVAAAPPMGRFLYKGKNMVDIETGSPWARKGAKKVLVSKYGGRTAAKPLLSYSGNAKAEWFEVAKKVDGKEWIAKTKRTAGGG